MFRFLPRLAAAVSTAVRLAAVVATPALADDSKTAAKPSATVTKVEPKKVCMINNAYMDKDQIPVEVQGKTYYGCCAMCKEKLAKDAAQRSAVDPVSGKTVDKATAVIGAKADGSVLYFENDENLAKYVAEHSGS